VRVKTLLRQLRTSGCWLAGLLVVTADAQTNFTTLRTNGPASNRLNVVLLAEGYRTSDYGKFGTDATNTLNLWLAASPFAQYQTYFNAYSLAVPSVEAGSDHPAYGQLRNTYFNSSYDAADYLITIPTNATGQGKVDALLNAYVPAANLAILLVNDNTLGGSDGGGRTVISSANPNSLSYIPIHESGHVLAGLGDEYTAAYPGYPDTEEPNTTRETNRAAIKWNAWIDPGTPVPTPANYSDAVVGLFEGAHYHPIGWFRPQVNCTMKSAGVPFCDVCREALVLAIYRQVRPVEAFTPATTNLSVTTTQALTFTLTVLQPASHALAIQWWTNGVALAGATNASLTLPPALLGNGTNTIAGRVTDPTPFVRNDPSNLLSQTLTWKVQVSLPELQLTAPRRLGTGQFTFHVAGVAPSGFAIQASTNLVNWFSVATNTLLNGHADYTNLNATNLPLRFFRAVTPP
jgi:hypothetical protein